MYFMVCMLIVSEWVMWQVLGMQVMVVVSISRNMEELKVVIIISVNILLGIEIRVLSVWLMMVLCQLFEKVVNKVMVVLERLVIMVDSKVRLMVVWVLKRMWFSMLWFRQLLFSRNLWFMLENMLVLMMVVVLQGEMLGLRMVIRIQKLMIIMLIQVMVEWWCMCLMGVVVVVVGVIGVFVLVLVELWRVFIGFLILDWK